jgi:ABC-type glycerol-3-phosphate transport system substrate-binding protein
MNKKVLSRRDVLKLMGYTTVAGVLTACGSKTPITTQSVAPATTAATKVSETTTLVNSVVPKAASGGFNGIINIAQMAGPEADAHVRLSPLFKELTKNTLIPNIESVGRDVWWSRWTTNFQSQSSDWDIVGVHLSQFMMAAPAGWITPLSDYQNDPELFNDSLFNLEDFPSALLDLFTRDGKLYEYPQEASTYMLFYRKDLLEKWGLELPGPEGYSYKQLIENVRKAKEMIEKEGLKDAYPLVYGVKGEMSSITFEQLAWSYGADLFVDKKMPNFNCPEAVAALEEAISWSKDGLVSPGIAGYEYPEVSTSFQQGTSVFALQWNAAAADILNKEKSPITAGNTAFSVFPYDEGKGPNQLRIWPSVFGSAISAFSKKPAESFEYLTWFASSEIARDYVMNGGGSSGRNSLLTDAEILEQNPQYEAMLQGFKNYHPFPELEGYGYINASILPPNLQNAWLGTVSAKEALDKATEEAIKYLEDQGEI